MAVRAQQRGLAVAAQLAGPVVGPGRWRRGGVIGAGRCGWLRWRLCRLCRLGCWLGGGFGRRSCAGRRRRPGSRGGVLHGPAAAVLIRALGRVLGWVLGRRLRRLRPGSPSAGRRCRIGTAWRPGALLAAASVGWIVGIRCWVFRHGHGSGACRQWAQALAPARVGKDSEAAADALAARAETAPAGGWGGVPSARIDSG